jgi:hypothetical protein
MVLRNEWGEAMNKEQLDKRIDEVCEQFKGQIPDLAQMIGYLIMGQRYGWRVVRLVIPRRVWREMGIWFGDPKTLMPERGDLTHKSQGLKLADDLHLYWDIISGKEGREGIPLEKRRMAA